jgi:hypothetical protein
MIIEMMELKHKSIEAVLLKVDGIYKSLASAFTPLS